MTSFYCIETLHIEQIQTRIPPPYFCRRQESESVSGNVNEPLHKIIQSTKQVPVTMALGQ